MRQSLVARVEYGRRIRERADCLLEAHGGMAETAARRAAGMPGAVEDERRFWEAVAARVVRLTSEPHWEPLFA